MVVNDASVGIIGGADGPTKIIVAGGFWDWVLELLLLAVIIAAVVLLIRWLRKRKKK